MFEAAIHGRRGERYLAAGRHMTMLEILRLLERVSGIQAPTRRLPLPLLYAVAAGTELLARVSHRPVLVRLEVVRLMAAERDRTRFDHSKSERELGIRFRPVEDTFKDDISCIAKTAGGATKPA